MRLPPAPASRSRQGAATGPGLLPTFVQERSAARARQIDEDIGDPYRAQYRPEATVTAENVPVHSYFRDLALVAEAETARPSRSSARLRKAAAAAATRAPRGFRRRGGETTRLRLPAAASPLRSSAT